MALDCEARRSSRAGGYGETPGTGTRKSTVRRRTWHGDLPLVLRSSEGLRSAWVPAMPARMMNSLLSLLELDDVSFRVPPVEHHMFAEVPCT